MSAELETQGASLNWGGLFDYPKLWSAPHCGHRRGTEIDLSMSVFDRFDTKTQKDMKKELAKALRNSEFGLPVKYERPEDPNSNHWHIVGQ